EYSWNFNSSLLSFIAFLGLMKCWIAVVRLFFARMMNITASTACVAIRVVVGLFIRRMLTVIKAMDIAMDMYSTGVWSFLAFHAAAVAPRKRAAAIHIPVMVMASIVAYIFGVILFDWSSSPPFLRFPLMIWFSSLSISFLREAISSFLG